MAEVSPHPGRGWSEFAPLYDQHHQRLYRVAMLLCNGSSAAAEDAVAETFERVYRTWSNGEVDHFFSYARQTLVNYMMGQFRRRKLALSYLSAHLPARQAPGAVEDRVVEASAVFDLLEKLPPRQRTAVVLRYYEDLSFEQVASTMGVSVGTAKAQVSVGLQKMRQMTTRAEAS
jgi:RNA polymerase sigma-70 factor (sigma-E family)